MIPLVSTVVTTRNRAALLGGAVHSALSQYDYDGKPIAQEIIIADDGSTDNTPQIARDFEREHPGVVRYHPVTTGSCAGTRNAGASTATAPALAFLDDDDEWVPLRLQKGLDALAAHPDAAFVYGQATPTDIDLQPSPGVAPAFPPLPLAEGHPVAAFLLVPPHMNATLFRRDVFTRFGGFDESLSGFEDVDLVVRIVREHPVYAVQEPLTLMRFHTDALNSANKMWKRFVDETRSRRGHMAVRDRFRPPLRSRIKMELAYRGWYVHRFLTVAANAAAAGDAASAANAVRYALRVSPLHAIKSPLFWLARRVNQKEQTA